jgi:site-specific recombinase XerD
MNNKVKEIIDKPVLKKIFDYYKYSKHKYREKLRNHTMFRLLYDTGLRISELLSLQVRDIDFDTSTIHVKITKTKNERYVFFTTKSKSLLKKLITMNKDSNYLFINYKRNKRMTVNNVQKVCFRLEQSLNLPYRVRPHRWRHTFATTFLKNGGDLETLRLILGHSNLKTTQLYLHLDKDHLHSEYFKIFKR